MGKTKDTGHLSHIVQYDVSNNITIPAGLKVNGADDVMTAAAMTSTLGGYVPASRIITINGTALDLSADRSFTIAGGLTSFNTRTGAITLSSGDVTTALGFMPSANTHTHSFADITTKPTTLTGYGITDAVPSTRTITINGTTLDLSANRSFTIAAGLTSFNTRTGAITLSLGDVTTALGFTPYNSTNPLGFITGITSTMVTNSLGYTPYNSTNPSGYIAVGSSISNGFGLADQKLYLRGFGDNNHFLWNADDDWEEMRYYGGTGFRIQSSTAGSTASFTNAGFTSSGFIRVNSNENLYLDYNYGQSIVGVYSSTRYQGVFSMGNAYKLPIDGTSPGNLYGMAWSHPNAGGVASNLNTHGLLVMENGTFLAAISGSIRARDDVRAPAIYDSGSRVAISRGEGRNYVDYSRYVYNNGAYSGSGWIEPSDLGVRYASSSGSASSLSGFDKTNPSFGAVYANNWFRAQGDCGLYQQDYGGHIARNYHSSHGTWTVWGYNKGGYAGINIMDPQGYWNNYMHESGSGGLYSQNYRGDWIWYHSAPNNCTSFNGSAADGGVRFRVNGSMRVTSDFNPQGYTGFGGNVEWANGSTQYHGSNTAYNWRDWGGWGGYWWSRNGGDMIMNLYALYSVTGSISDIRYKKDVEALPYGLKEIMQLNPIKYHYNLPKESMLANDPDYFLGFSAQEVQAIIPEAVHEKIGEDVESLKGMLAVTYDELIPVAVQAIKEQQVMIHNQNIKINRLETLLNQLLNN